ncbi:MAG: helix-turn-helix transcriptional regulator [Lachnospiraceae bacterium]|nr:helix-turn-helix transcriptional regulator [Lachnospiraceae bacterium]
MDTTFSFLSKAPGEIQEIIAGRLRQIRRKRKISQKKLSELSGVSLGSVKRFEQSGEIAFLSLIKIAYALGLDRELEHLFEEVLPLSMEEIIRGQD